MFSGFVVIQCQSFPLTSVFPKVLYEYGPWTPSLSTSRESFLVTQNCITCLVNFIHKLQNMKNTEYNIHIT